MKRHPCSGIRKLKIVKMAILLKSVYRFNIIAIKDPCRVNFNYRKAHSKI